MNYGVITIGSRGDVEPFIALGKGLQKRGHHVRITTFTKFKEYIESNGFEYCPLAGDAVEVIRLLVGEQVSSFEYFVNLGKLLNPIKEQFLSDIEKACQGMDAILYSLLGSVAWHVSDKYGIPCFRVSFCPIDPTNEFPAMTAPIVPFWTAPYNRLTFWFGDRLWSNATRKLLNDWRIEMGLQKIKPFVFPYRYLHGKEIPTLYAYSSVISPKPHEYSNEKHITGFWIEEKEENYQPDEKLANFLDSGDKPIYIGFGSAVGGDFDQALSIVLESLKKTNQRAILSAGWGNLKGVKLPETVLQVDFVPHRWLFKRVSAVAHHGGAGTTGAGVRAKVPSIIIPFGGDQPFWGNRVYKLGIGPKPILRKKLNVNNFSNAIYQATHDQQMIKKSQEIGNILNAENGVENAIQIMERKTIESKQKVLNDKI
jgi:UDP:flavonoid glycosyltransferase YjiC (YdhE family)